MRDPIQRLAAAALLIFACGLGWAQTYPSKPIRLVVPFPPGGTADIAARTVAGALSQGLGQQVVVDNRGGADGAIAGAAVIASPPDGYTLFFATTTALNAAPTLHKSPPYDPVTAFTPISLVGRFGFFLMVHESVPAKTVPELLAHIRANPGKVNYATGNGTSILTTAQLGAAEKLDMTHVPYKGDAPASADLIAGRVQLSISTLSAGVLPQIQQGHLRVLATLLPDRSPLVPQAPTAAEAGSAASRSRRGAGCSARRDCRGKWSIGWRPRCASLPRAKTYETGSTALRSRCRLRRRRRWQACLPISCRSGGEPSRNSE